MNLSELLDDDPAPLTESGRALGEATTATYVLHQEVSYRYTAPITALAQRLVVVPRHRHRDQRRLAERFSVDGCPDAAVHRRTDRFGNAVLRVTAPEVHTSIAFRTRAVVRRAVHQETPAGWGVPRSSTPLNAPDDALRDAAAPFHALRDPAERADAIATLVHRSIAYRHGVTSVRTTAAEAWSGRAGVCQDMAHVMIAMCTAVGLPARYVSGHLVGDGASHAWVEVLDERHRRVLSIDPTHDRRTDLRYLVTAVGRDYRDVAPLSGTYTADGARGRLSVRKRVLVADAA